MAGAMPHAASGSTAPGMHAERRPETALEVKATSSELLETCNLDCHSAAARAVAQRLGLGAGASICDAGASTRTIHGVSSPRGTRRNAAARLDEHALVVIMGSPDREPAVEGRGRRRRMAAASDRAGPAAPMF